MAVKKRSGLAMEFWLFLKHNKKWWMTPIILFFLLMVLLVVLNSTGVAPLMYTIF